MRSDPAGTGYSNSIVACIGHLLSRISRSTSMIGVSPSPNGVVRPFLHLAILHVHVRDARVMLLQERHRRRVVAGDEVAEVEVRASCIAPA